MGLTWLASYPKSGNTWLRLLLATLADGGVRPRLSALGTRIPTSAALNWVEEFVDLPTGLLLSGEQKTMRIEAHRLAALAARKPVWLKIHDQFDPSLFAPDVTDRTIYVVRDPRDVALSWADHLGISAHAAVERMNCADFRLSQVGPDHRTQTEQLFGSWSDHVRSWTEHPGHPLLVLRYEDMLAEPIMAAHRLASFLNLECSAATISAAVAACRFAALSEAEAQEGFNERRPHQKRFFRKGRSQAGRESLDFEQISAIERAHGATMRQFGYVLESVSATDDSGG